MGKNKQQQHQQQKKNESKQPNKQVKKLDDLPYEYQHVQDITLFKHPLYTIKYFMIVVFNNIMIALKFILKYWYIVLILAGIIIAPYHIEGPHSEKLQEFEDILYFMGYWILLGVASSIGLGTGLHTFVLYLGPWIAKVTMVAYQCNAIPDMVPSKWNFKHFAECPKNVERDITFFDILMSVQFEAFLWGFGTALGELPPYFVAKAAAASAKKVEELEEIDHEKNDNSLMARTKRVIYNNLQKYGFITVLICASIPNPLFDLAGITCGHFGIPFMVFFGATCIGKSIIKTHLQMIFVILMFSQQTIERLLSVIEDIIPSLRGTLSEMLEKNKRTLTISQDIEEGDKPLVAQLWDYFIILMISYFLLSTVNSLAQGYLEEQKQEMQKKKK
ncbi:hypothetical protein PPERSA_12616 [Pseudocohnilembus persalinus]|uniref:Vacuole membrane protein 1 n=1 Tax=Pseudocohnilembus persalinus TaxID=266149 RepID=A0A0V0QCX6_PSEPJ|nr:hypothetical protein PPERSA_12616 [Pseudocohnilembus persalinus]|eukprot:KRW99940.1 hypothetical protein PPERSA_12616 [Pseudocohnilembus persalinus]